MHRQWLARADPSMSTHPLETAMGDMDRYGEIQTKRISRYDAICIAFFLTSFRLMSRLWTPRFKKSVKSSNECRMHCRRGDRSAVLILQGSVRVYSMDESSVIISCLLEHVPKVPNQSRISKWTLEMIGSSTLVRDSGGSSYTHAAS